MNVAKKPFLVALLARSQAPRGKPEHSLPIRVAPLVIAAASEDEMLVCGMSLGYADPEATANVFRTTRVGVEAFTTWL